MLKMSETIQVKKDSKPVETLILANCGTKKDGKNDKLNKELPVVKKEDEKIITKVMTIIDGYDWNLVQPEKKSSAEIKKEHIKRPMNAFMVWAQAARKVMSKQHPHLQNSELSKSLGKLWKGLDKADRQPFIDYAEKLRTNHKQEHPDYKYQPRRKKSKLMNNMTSTNNSNVSNIQACTGGTINNNNSITKHTNNQQKINSRSDNIKTFSTSSTTPITSIVSTTSSTTITNKRTYNTQNNRNDKIRKGNTITTDLNLSKKFNNASNTNLEKSRNPLAIVARNDSNLIHTNNILLNSETQLEKFANNKNISVENKINLYSHNNLSNEINFTNSSTGGNFFFTEDRLNNRILDTNTNSYEETLWKRIDVKTPDIIRKLDYIRQIDSPCSTSSSLISMNEAQPLTPPTTPYTTTSMPNICNSSIPMVSLTPPVPLIKRTSPKLHCTQSFVSPNQLLQQQQSCDYTEYSRIPTTIQTPSTSSSSSVSSTEQNHSNMPYGHESYSNNSFHKPNNISNNNNNNNNNNNCSDPYVKSSSYIPNYNHLHNITSYGQHISNNFDDCCLPSSYLSPGSTIPTTTSVTSITYANYPMQLNHQQPLHFQQQSPQSTTSTNNHIMQNFLAPIDADYVDPKEIDQYLIDASTSSSSSSVLATVAMHHQQNQIHNSIKIPTTTFTCNPIKGTVLIPSTANQIQKIKSQVSLNASSTSATSIMSATVSVATANSGTTNSILYNKIHENCNNNLLELQQRVDNKCMSENLNKINLANAQGAIQILNHSTGTNLQATNNLQSSHNNNVSILNNNNNDIEDDDDDDNDIDDDEDNINSNSYSNAATVEYYQSSSNNDMVVETNSTNPYPYATWNYS